MNINIGYRTAMSKIAYLASFILFLVPTSTSAQLMLEVRVSKDECARICKDGALGYSDDTCLMAYYFLSGPNSGLCRTTLDERPNLQMSGKYNIWSGYFQTWLTDSLISYKWPNTAQTVLPTVDQSDSNTIRTPSGLCANPLPSGYEWFSEKSEELWNDCKKVGLVFAGWLTSSGWSCAETNTSATKTGYEVDHGSVCEKSYPGRYVDWCYSAASTSIADYKYNVRCIVRK